MKKKREKRWWKRATLDIYVYVAQVDAPRHMVLRDEREKNNNKVNAER
jgi:hypothetical protein